MLSPWQEQPQTFRANVQGQRLMHKGLCRACVKRFMDYCERSENRMTAAINVAQGCTLNGMSA
jgi:hypothetical protein